MKKHSLLKPSNQCEYFFKEILMRNAIRWQKLWDLQWYSTITTRLLNKTTTGCSYFTNAFNKI